MQSTSLRTSLIAARASARRVRYLNSAASSGSSSSSSDQLASSSQSPPPPPSSSSSPISNERTTHFGFRSVPESQKESLVGNVFSSVASKYDVLNDAMSLGIHRMWKESFVSELLPRLPPSVHRNDAREWKPTFQCLDVAGGTGDIALKILDRAREKYGNRDVRVEIVDLNEGMLGEGRKRVAKTLYYNSKPIKTATGKIKADFLPFDSPTNRIHTRQRARSTQAHCRQLDRPLHDRIRDPKLHLITCRAQGGSSCAQARWQDWRARVW